MPTDKGADDVMVRYLTSEVSSMNAQLPKARKTLSALLEEEHPRVVCLDGSEHSFKTGELSFLASILDDRERKSLLLPMIIEVRSGRGEMLVRSSQGVESKVLARVLGMPVTREKAGVRIYRSQLGALRSVLMTATQYVFTL
jgi:uncharacterized protein (UPF0216 family)